MFTPRLALVPVLLVALSVSGGGQPRPADPPKAADPPPDRPAAWVKDRLTAVDAKLAAELKDLVGLYQHLHANPELSLMEVKTAARMADEVRKLGYEVTEKVGGNGVVAVLKNGPGPVVLIRTDMDALPVVEQTGLPYASRVKTKDRAGTEVGVMHACGHDIHMTKAIPHASA